MANNATYAETLLSVRDVSLTLGGKRILRDVDCEIKNIIGHGQVVGFLGPSGIGKTQLLRILAGLQKPDSGTVRVNSEQVNVRAGMVGVVAQHYPLFEHQTVLGNLVLAGRRAGISRAAAREKSFSLLERFGLSEHAHFWPAQLSGGQRQRVAIAQQLMCSEHFLLMDEPFSGLDPIALGTVCRLVKETADLHELNTIIVVTHDVDAAVEVSDTLWLMGRERDPDGKIIPGARIRRQIDLVERDLAWRENVHQLPQFADTVREIRAEFPNL